MGAIFGVGYAPFKLLRKHRADGESVVAEAAEHVLVARIEAQVVRVVAAFRRGRPVAPEVALAVDKAVAAAAGSRKEHAVG